MKTRDRRAGRHLPSAALVDHHAGEDARFVGLAPLGGEARRARTAPVEIGLDVGDVERDQRRAAVDDAADPRPVAFAEGGDAEEMAESVVGHGQRSAVSYGAAAPASNRVRARAAVSGSCVRSSRSNRSRATRRARSGNRSSSIHVRLAIEYASRSPCSQTRNGETKMLKKLAAIGLGAALDFLARRPMAQTTPAPTLRPPPPRRSRWPQKMKHKAKAKHVVKKHPSKKMPRSPWPRSRRRRRPRPRRSRNSRNARTSDRWREAARPKRDPTAAFARRARRPFSFEHGSTAARSVLERRLLSSARAVPRQNP